MLKNRKVKIVLSLSLLVLMLTFNFMTNFLSVDKIGGYPFSTFQADSERLVISKIDYDNLNIKNNSCNYGLCGYDNTTQTFIIYLNLDYRGMYFHF